MSQKTFFGEKSCFSVTNHQSQAAPKRLLRGTEQHSFGEMPCCSITKLIAPYCNATLLPCFVLCHTLNSCLIMAFSLKP